MDRREDQEAAAPNPKLFVGGLAWEATDEDLNAAFAPFGELVSANVVRYSDTGRSKGFAFVEYKTVEESTKAKDEMNGKEIAGRTISIDFARPRVERSDR